LFALEAIEAGGGADLVPEKRLPVFVAVCGVLDAPVLKRLPNGLSGVLAFPAALVVAGPGLVAEDAPAFRPAKGFDFVGDPVL